MSNSTRANQQLQFSFSENPQEYAPWVATHGLLAPYGECQCGCGQPAPIAKKTNTQNGRRKGSPVRYILGHNAWVYAPPGFKVCSMCQETKPLAEFYARKGGRSNSYCVPCARQKAKNFRDDHLDESIERERKYARENKEILRAKERERRADPDHREKASVRLKDWRERNKEHVTTYNRTLQVKARNRVNKLIVSGKLPRPDTLLCADCQQTMAAHYHHQSGYERQHWLDVVALCTECHGKAHRIDFG